MEDQTESAFVESTPTTEEGSYRGRPLKNIKLAMTEDGVIDWESTSPRHTDAFINAIKNDPNGILKNIQEEAGKESSEAEDIGSGISDGVVLTCMNVVMITEAVLFSTVGQRFAPVLKNLHPVVAIKACAVEMDDIKPILPAAKRMIKRYVPMEYLDQEYQDIFIVAEHLVALSAVKFKQCIELAQQIEQLKYSAANKPNGQASVVDATFEEDKKVQ